jgi:hypothetical protein
MVSSKATTVAAYLASLPSDRRAAIDAVRRTVSANLPSGYDETMQYGMISWIIPLSRYPTTYNGQPLAMASLGAQKNYNALYLVCAYQDPALTAIARPASASTWASRAFASSRPTTWRSTRSAA